MSKIRLIVKKMLVGILVTSLIISISVSESYAEDVIDNTEITENEEQAEADIPADIHLLDVEYEVNAVATALDGTTSVEDGGTLSYQWYKLDGTEYIPITDAKDAVYIPDTSIVGEYKYKVIATNTIVVNDEEILATKESNIVTVVIKEKDNGEIKAEKPADIILSDKEYVLNSDAVEIDGTTSVTDGGILTYQWYKDGEIMKNEVNSKIMPDTSVLGEHRYKVIATNTLYDENENIIATASKESNEICVKIINDSDIKDDLDGKEDLDNKDDFANKDNQNNKDGLDKGDNPDFNDGFGKDKVSGMDIGPGKGTKPGNGKNIGLLDKNIPGMNGKMPNMGKFPGQLQNRGNTKLTQTSSKNSTTTTLEEEEDTSYKEVEIENSEIDDELTIKYGEGKIYITVKDDNVNELANIVLTSAENVIGACLSDSDLKKAYEGKTIKIKVIAKMINGEVPEEDEDLIKEGTSALKSQVDGLTIGDYLDISVSKKIGDNDWSKLTDLQKRLKIVLTLPTGISQKDGDKYIIRLHDGEYVLVKDMDEDEKTFTFSTKYFSTYAVAFVSATSDKKESKNVIEKKHTVAWTIGSISTIILIVLIVYFVIRKKKRYFR